jgi:hypothetical protein
MIGTKRWRFFWSNGNISMCSGLTAEGALIRAGYEDDAIADLDYYEEVTA